MMGSPIHPNIIPQIRPNGPTSIKIPVLSDHPGILSNPLNPFREGDLGQEQPARSKPETVELWVWGTLVGFLGAGRYGRARGRTRNRVRPETPGSGLEDGFYFLPVFFGFPEATAC